MIQLRRTLASMLFATYLLQPSAMAANVVGISRVSAGFSGADPATGAFFSDGFSKFIGVPQFNSDSFSDSRSGGPGSSVTVDLAGTVKPTEIHATVSSFSGAGGFGASAQGTVAVEEALGFLVTGGTTSSTGSSVCTVKNPCGVPGVVIGGNLVTFTGTLTGTVDVLGPNALTNASVKASLENLGLIDATFTSAAAIAIPFTFTLADVQPGLPFTYHIELHISTNADGPSTHSKVDMSNTFEITSITPPAGTFFVPDLTNVVVPLPGALTLFASSVAGLLGLPRRWKRTTPC